MGRTSHTVNISTIQHSTMKLVHFCFVLLLSFGLGEAFRIPDVFGDAVETIEDILQNHDRQTGGEASAVNAALIPTFGAVLGASIVANVAEDFLTSTTTTTTTTTQLHSTTTTAAPTTTTTTTLAPTTSTTTTVAPTSSTTSATTTATTAAPTTTTTTTL